MVKQKNGKWQFQPNFPQLHRSKNDQILTSGPIKPLYFLSNIHYASNWHEQTGIGRRRFGKFVAWGVEIECN
jgi:hypothetical protein